MSYIVNKLPNTAKPIPGTISNWVDVDGSFYGIDGRKGHGNHLIKKVQHTTQGYKYVGLNFINGKRITKRAHRIVAQVFIPNPNNYPVVGHKNNIKTDNRVENLYWTTVSENTQKAFDDGLIKNAKGFDDSQSMPVKMFETKTNKLLGIYGSIREAAEKTGLNAVMIGHQAKYKRPVRKPFYFRYFDDPCCDLEIVAMVDYDSDNIIETYINISDAAKKSGYNNQTISMQCFKGKPKHKFLPVYFKFINNKCEETIEI